jgi:L-aspartate oxidase
MPVLEQRDWADFQEQNEDEMILIAHMWEEIRRLMWNYVGIVRSNRRLERAQKRITNIMAEMQDYCASSKLHPDIIELRNIALIADLTIRCALMRKESRGIHYNLDFPHLAETARDTILMSH